MKIDPSSKKLGLFILVVVIAISGLVYLVNLTPNTRAIKIGTNRLNLLVAKTTYQQQKGLGAIKSIPANSGMLFVFDQPQYECFWMKGMNFPLDMIWLTGEGTVNHIETNIAPDTFPQAFCDPQKSSYVIELNAGESIKLGLRLGQVINL